MLATLLSALVFALVVAVAMAALYAVTVVPFVLALTLAERRGFSTGRWGGLALVAVLLGLALAAVAHLSDAPRPVQALLLLLGFAAPLALYLMDGQERLGGRAGRHETPL